MDATFWQKQWDAFIAAPIASLIFLVVGAVAAWWFRGKTMGGERDALKAHIASLEERHRLAMDKMEEREAEKTRLEDELKKLREQIATNAPKQTLQTTSQMATAALARLSEFDDEMADFLGPPIRRFTVIPKAASGRMEEGARREMLLTALRKEYIEKYNALMKPGEDPPESWVNKRLTELRETWRVRIGKNH